MTAVETNKKSNKWIWIGLGAALLFCLCAIAVAVVVAGRIGKQVEQGMKTDPAGAAESAHAIAEYTLPAGYQEEMAMDLFVYTMVVISPESTGSSSNDKPIIMLAQFKAGTNQQQMQEQIRQSFEQQSGQRGFSMKVVETRQMTIRGEEVDVVTYEGTDDSGNSMRQVITTFPGKGGTAMLMIIGEPQDWDEEEIDTFIESIH
jgi:flagellar basal body-associated protein FliL